MDSKKTFSINAQTCTFKCNAQENGTTILSLSDEYVIPVYQRPYSWGEEQLRQFISDIFLSFWGNEGTAEPEPMFFGTMQLSFKNQDGEVHVIDGQQRLTTLLILFRVLQKRFPGCAELEAIPLDWLSTKVNNGEQQKLLDEFLKNDLTFAEETLNSYKKNAKLVDELITEQISGDHDNPSQFDIEKFAKYLLSDIYFVVIETLAGLSKTLQIFNAINTTGLDLNGGDIFKIRMYEYLRDKKGESEAVFDEISKLYAKIDAKNAALEEVFTSIHEVLTIYQFILIANNDLSTALYSYNVDTFFERLFDTIFNINKWEHFKNIELSLAEIDRIIEVRYEWQCTNWKTLEDALAANLLWKSRYGRYWNLVYVFLYRFKDEDGYWDKMLLFVRQLSKLYTIYSVSFLKAINAVHTFSYELNRKILHDSYEEIIEFINREIASRKARRDYGDLENAICGDITYNAKIKNILCRLSAMLHEDCQKTDSARIHEIVSNIFYTPLDVEHIQSYHDKNGVREDIWSEWGVDINSIGNLVLLEQGINRSISNNPYHEKKLRYPESKLKIVRDLADSHSEWNLSKCRERKEAEYNKIIAYLFQDIAF